MADIPEKRVIKINEDLFKYTSNTTRKKREPKIPAPKIKVRDPHPKNQSKTLKRNLLKYIRRFQDEIHKESRAPPSGPATQSVSDAVGTAPSDNFKDSVDYLLKLTKDLENRERANTTVVPKNHTLKHRADLHIHEVLNNVNPAVPVQRPAATVLTNTMVSLDMPTGLGEPVAVFQREPEYGCLKNGRKPTYRIWKNHTQRAYSVPPAAAATTARPTLPADPVAQRIQQIQQRAKITRINQIASSPAGGSIPAVASVPPVQAKPESQKLADIIKREQMKQMKQMKPTGAKIKHPKQCRKTMRRTYRVGRSKVAPKISVLVSNKTIRKNVTTQAQLLKQTPIKDVKQYLIRAGLIRVGSIAPNDVLRRMYETAKMMCGEIRNHNPDNLLYNFLNGEGEP